MPPGPEWVKVVVSRLGEVIVVLPHLDGGDDGGDDDGDDDGDGDRHKDDAAVAGDDEAPLLVARRLRREHALAHRPPDPWHEHHPALHEGFYLWINSHLFVCF